MSQEVVSGVDRFGADSPRVTIGMPVRNGEPFLTTALQSMIEQKFDDFEIVISDNASDDRTEEICRAMAAVDRRIRYYRNSENIGAARNYNRTFELARGEYFTWLAHDDYRAPEWLARCVATLERDRSIVLCYSGSVHVNESGDHVEIYADPLVTSRRSAAVRFHHVIWSMDNVYAVFGLINRAALAQTGLIRVDPGSDRLLLAELSLLGRFERFSEYLSFIRMPHHFREPRNRSWWAPENADRLPLRTWRLYLYHLKVVRQSSSLHPVIKVFLSSDVTARFLLRDARRMAAEAYHSIGLWVRSRLGSAPM